MNSEESMGPKDDGYHFHYGAMKAVLAASPWGTDAMVVVTE